MTLTREQEALCNFYKIEHDGNGRYTSITNTGAQILLGAQLDALTYALSSCRSVLATNGLSDDDYDYTNAIIQQLDLWHTLIFWDMDHAAEDLVTDRILAILNLTREELESHLYDDYGVECLQNGFADHASPLGTLTHLNDD